MNNPTPDKVFYVWLQSFVSSLKDKGLPISPDTHLLLIKVFETCSEKITGENIIDYMAPVIVKNTGQLKILREEYAAFLTKQFPPLTKEERSAEDGRRPVKHWYQQWFIKFIAVALFLLTAIALYFLMRTTSIKVTASALVTINNNVGDPVRFDGSKSFFENPKDTQHANYVQFVWDFGDGEKDSGKYITEHRYKKPGNYSSSLKLSPRSPNVSILKSDTSQQVIVCKPPLNITTNSPYEIETGQQVEFKIDYDASYPPSQFNTWYINDTPAQKNSYVFSHIFYSPGTQLVRFSSNDTSGNSCPEQAFTNLSVKPPGQIFINISGKDSGDVKPVIAINKRWLWIMASLIIIPLLVTAWLRWRLSKKEKISRAKAENIIEGLNGNSGPFEIPFRNHDELIEDEKELLDVAKSYNRRNTDAVHYLDIPQTINSTIRSEGMINPVWSSKTKPVEFLMLIDKNKVKNQQVRLFEYLLKKFSRNDLYLEKFYFLFEPDVCTNIFYPNGIHLSRLHDLYPNHVVIIFGTGHQLIDQHYPSLNEPLLQLFRKWDQFAICTPLPVADWDYKEKILQSAAVLLPADLKGQLLLFRLLENNKMEYEDQLSKMETYRTKPFDFQDVTQLQQYLNDPFLFQWICSIAVYPRIRWDVTVAIGEALQAENYKGRDINYSALLKIVRIKWMEDGSFPDNTRLELLKMLEPKNEKVARETMIRLMDEAARKMDSNSFSFEELQMQRMTDKFLLYANDPAEKKYQAYEKSQDEFKALWEQGQILDTSLSGYLRNEPNGKSWSTLINNKVLSKEPGAGDSIDELFKDGVHLQKKRTKNVSRVLIALSSLVAILLIALLFGGKKINGTSLDKSLSLTSIDNTVPVTFRLAFNQCWNATQMAKDSAKLVFSLPGNQLRELNATDTILSFNINSVSAADSVVNLTVISSNGQYNLDTSFKLLQRDMTFEITGCPIAVPSCGRWVLDTKGKAEAMGGSVFDAYITMASLSSYRPTSIFSDAGKYGSIDNKEILEMYTCDRADSTGKVILKNTDNSLQVLYMQTIGDSRFFELAYSKNSFRSIKDARSDTSIPYFQQKVFLPAFIYITDNTDIWSHQSYQGSWANGRDTLSVLPETNQLIYLKKQWDIRSVQKDQSGELTVYKLLLTNKSKSGANSSLFICTVKNINKILVNEKMYTPAELEKLRPGFGTLNTFTRTTVKTDTTAASILSNLPSSLAEMWSDNTNKQILLYDPGAKRFYYSANGKSANTIFSIVETYRNANEVYKTIVSTDYGYKVFFFKNITQQSFELAVCPKEFESRAEAIKITDGQCGSYVPMKLFYDNDPAKIFLPLDDKSYASSEIRKMNAYLGTQSEVASGRVLVDSILVYVTNINPTSNPKELEARLEEIKRTSPLGKFTKANWTITNFSYMPFERHYIRVITKDALQDININGYQQNSLPPKASVKKILWVDDNPDDNSSLMSLIRSDAVEIRTAQSNAEALKLFSGGTYDLVISDVERGKEGAKAGLQLYDAIKKYNSKTPFIFYTMFTKKGEADFDVAAKKGALLTTSNSNELLDFLEENFNMNINRPKSAN
ncbi:MAG: PKD domain-containing protein [Ferruginibacter sp.]